MNYVILEKARPYTRTRKGRFEQVKGYGQEKLPLGDMVDDLSENHDVRQLQHKIGGYEGWTQELKKFNAGEDSAVIAMKGLISKYLINQFKIYPKSNSQSEILKIREFKNKVTFMVIKKPIFDKLDEQVGEGDLSKDDARDIKEDFDVLIKRQKE